jgi:branched-subunit amino acid transport protein
MSAIETMATTWVWTHIVAVAVATYLLRFSFIGVSGYYDIPAEIKAHMNLVPPAVLAALALPPLFYRNETWHLSPGNPFLIAGIVGALVAWQTDGLIWTLVAGFLTYFVVTF